MITSGFERKILYVAGYGRSGSTLLCAVLGGSEHSVPVGEFKAIFKFYSEGRLCSCGSALSECEFWRDVVESFQAALPDVSLKEAAEVTTRIESHSNWLSLRYRNTKIEQKYQLIWATMIDCVCNRSGSSLIIDASKSSSVACNRVAVLSRIVSIQHVHLVRDPRAVMSSTLVGQTRRLERHGIKPVRLRGVRTLLSWTATNTYIHLMHLVGLQRVQSRISYEMLTGSPKECLLHLQRSLSIDVETLQEKLRSDSPFIAGHIFSGDLQRMKGEYHIRDNPAKWPNQLSTVQKMVSFLTFPLGRYYGFFKSTPRDSKQG